jgi:hypothetical protein
VLISKVIQNLANGIEFGSKEEFMKPTNDFIMAHMDEMQNFLDRISVTTRTVISLIIFVGTSRSV